MKDTQINALADKVLKVVVLRRLSELPKKKKKTEKQFRNLAEKFKRDIEI